MGIKRRWLSKYLPYEGLGPILSMVNTIMGDCLEMHAVNLIDMICMPIFPKDIRLW